MKRIYKTGRRTQEWRQCLKDMVSEFRSIQTDGARQVVQDCLKVLDEMDRPGALFYLSGDAAEEMFTDKKRIYEGRIFSLYTTVRAANRGPERRNTRK